jgi:hypothetical protein
VCNLCTNVGSVVGITLAQEPLILETQCIQGQLHQPGLVMRRMMMMIMFVMIVMVMIVMEISLNRNFNFGASRNTDSHLSR